MTLGDAVTQAVLLDWTTAPIDERLRATLGFLRKLTLEPDALTGADAAAVLATGTSPQALEDAIVVAAGFNAIDRVADALGFEVPDAAGFEASGRSLLRFGYVV